MNAYTENQFTPQENARIAMQQYRMFRSLFNDELLAIHAAGAILKTKEARQEFELMLNLEKQKDNDSNVNG
jgi:hypothetical protein